MTIPAPALADVYQVRLEGTFMGEPCANVLAVRDETSAMTVDDVATNFDTAYQAAHSAGVGSPYRSDISNQRTMTNLHVVAYDAASPFVTDEALSGANMTGSNTGQPLPYQLAICVTLTTGLASRRFRGRLFDYGFSESANSTTGHIEAVVRTAVDNFWNNFQLQLVAVDLTWGVLSRGWVNDGPGDTRASYAQSFTPITNVTVRDNLWDTMRSRVPT